MVIYIILYAVLVSILLMLVYLSHKLPTLFNVENDEESNEKMIAMQNYIYTGILLIIVAMLCNTYFLVKDTVLESHLMEWLNIVIRVMHITFGIAWIGASFYFVFLENALNRTEDIREELAGNLWAVHGGGFYYLEKYKVAPKTIPKHLHWFK